LDDDDASHFGTVKDIEDGEDEDIVQQQAEEEEELDDFGDINSQQESQVKASATEKKTEVGKTSKNKQKETEKTPKKKDKGKGKKKAGKQNSNEEVNSDDCEFVASPDSDKVEEEKSSKVKHSLSKSTPASTPTFTPTSTPKKQGSFSQTKTSSSPKKGVLKKSDTQKRDQPAPKDSFDACITILFSLFTTYISSLYKM
jgi:hypothetical protein